MYLVKYVITRGINYNVIKSSENSVTYIPKKRKFKRRIVIINRLFSSSNSSATFSNYTWKVINIISQTSYLYRINNNNKLFRSHFSKASHYFLKKKRKFMW